MIPNFFHNKEAIMSISPIIEHLKCAGIISISLISLNINTLFASDHTSHIEKDIGTFTHLELAGNCAVTISKSTKYTISVTVNDSLVPYLHIEQPGRTLKVFLDKRLPTIKQRFSVTITMPELKGIKAEGCSHVDLKSFTQKEDLDIELKDSSTLAGDVRCEDLDVELSAGSTLDLRGSCEDISLRAEGNSMAKLGQMGGEDLAVHLSGKSTALVNVSGHMAGVLEEGSRLRYNGNPGVRAVVTSGGSTITRIEEKTPLEL